MMGGFSSGRPSDTEISDRMPEAFGPVQKSSPAYAGKNEKCGGLGSDNLGVIKHRGCFGSATVAASCDRCKPFRRAAGGW
jgi:hypothetical protein